MSDLRYPDNGQPLEDASILRNAFTFGTAQRAFVAYNVLRQPLEHVNQEALAFLATEAFMLEMTSTEDLLAWLFVFSAWQPDEVNYSLWPLLHRIQVGVGNHSEERGAALLEGLDAPSFRQLVHIPTDEELTNSDIPLDVREGISRAMPANLEGMKRLVGLRQEANRLRVRAFNKLKHHFLALRLDDSPEKVMIPVWEGFDEDAQAISMATFTIACTSENTRLMASRSIIAQATLNSLLGIILWTRFGERHDTPPWSVRAFGLRGWYEEPAAPP